MSVAPRGADPASAQSSSSAILPLIASGLTVLLIVFLLALAAQGATFALVLALVLMVTGFAACYWLIQAVSTTSENPDAGRERGKQKLAERPPEPSIHDLPLDNPAHHTKARSRSRADRAA